MNRYRLFFFLIFVLFATVGCAAEEPTAVRTEYDALDLSSPATAVETFVQAFKNENYYAVFMIFSPNTQAAIVNKIELADYGALIDLADNSQNEAILAALPHNQPVETWEHGTSLYLFDELMLAAGQQSAFLLDLTGEVTINQTENRTETEADVYATVEGIEGEVIFRLAQSPNGRWRVQQLIAAGGDESQVPWAIGPR